MMVRCCKYLISVCLITIFTTLVDVTLSTEEYNVSPQNKNGRFLSMFEIINFPNDACNGGSKNGTCYTSAECEDKGGSKDGDCAQGYGVCCTFSVECGATVTQNNTYFSKPSSFSSGNCAIQVCPGEDICQLRLDFSSFMINGPYSVTDTADAELAKVSARYAWGSANNGAGTVLSVPLQGHCNKDSFTATSSSGNNPPVICGQNDGEHIYVDASSGTCNSLAFAIDSAASDASWTVQISQLECTSNNLAPEGCLQYNYGETEGKFRSFNWKGGNHLANQNQNICFRRESGKSKICYSYVDSNADFQVSNNQAMANSKSVWIGGTAVANAPGCCGYGNAGIGEKGGAFDCLQIPDATDGNDVCVRNLDDDVCVEGYFCGGIGLYATGGKKTDTLTDIKKTVCSKRTPFEVRFLTDGTEVAVNEVQLMKGLKGFELRYFQS